MVQREQKLNRLIRRCRIAPVEQGFGLVSKVDGEELRLTGGRLALKHTDASASTAKKQPEQDGSEHQNAGEHGDVLEQTGRLLNFGVEL